MHVLCFCGHLVGISMSLMRPYTHVVRSVDGLLHYERTVAPGAAHHVLGCQDRRGGALHEPDDFVVVGQAGHRVVTCMFCVSAAIWRSSR